MVGGQLDWEGKDGREADSTFMALRGEVDEEGEIVVGKDNTNLELKFPI